MELVTSNNQGELSPLEIGIHALNCVALEKGGRGKKGGLSEYAEQVGKSVTTLRELRSAAEVAEKSTVDRCLLLNSSQHLAAIHSLPEACWADAVAYMVKEKLSAADTRDRVQKAKDAAAGLNVPRRWAEYIDADRVAAKVAVNCSVDRTLLLDRAQVAEAVKGNIDITKLLDRAQHLAAIHSLPEACWANPLPALSPV